MTLELLKSFLESKLKSDDSNRLKNSQYVANYHQYKILLRQLRTKFSFFSFNSPLKSLYYKLINILNSFKNVSPTDKAINEFVLKTMTEITSTIGKVKDPKDISLLKDISAAFLKMMEIDDTEIKNMIKKGKSVGEIKGSVIFNEPVVKQISGIDLTTRIIVIGSGNFVFGNKDTYRPDDKFTDIIVSSFGIVVFGCEVCNITVVCRLEGTLPQMGSSLVKIRNKIGYGLLN